MTALTHAIQRHLPAEGAGLEPRLKRAAVVALFAVSAAVVPNGLQAMVDALADAYLSVTVFVAGTIALVMAAERGLGTDLPTLLRRYRRWHVPAGVLLGAFPGCGGAIIAVTQFTRGHLSFGAVVATLISTMGDAMFLLMAREPVTALAVTGISGVMGILCGYAVDAIHGPDFLRPKAAGRDEASSAQQQPWLPAVWRNNEAVWLTLAVPGLIIGLLGAFQVDVDDILPGSPSTLIGSAGALLALAMWVVRGGESQTCQTGTCGGEYPMLRRIVDDTNFVSSWVIFAFISYQVLVAGLAVDPAAAISLWGPLVPALAILVGFIPGCGPQIVVTSLYLAGSLPLSAQLGNAIANDGDALFPAIAAAPKAAMVATLYSALPALVTAYGWYLIFEVQ